jgi:hypothetical protein
MSTCRRALIHPHVAHFTILNFFRPLVHSARALVLSHSKKRKNGLFVFDLANQMRSPRNQRRNSSSHITCNTAFLNLSIVSRTTRRKRYAGTSTAGMMIFSMKETHWSTSRCGRKRSHTSFACAMAVTNGAIGVNHFQRCWHSYRSPFIKIRHWFSLSRVPVRCRSLLPGFAFRSLELGRRDHIGRVTTVLRNFRWLVGAGDAVNQSNRPRFCGHPCDAL